MPNCRNRNLSGLQTATDNCNNGNCSRTRGLINTHMQTNLPHPTTFCFSVICCPSLTATSSAATITHPSQSVCVWLHMRLLPADRRVPSTPHQRQSGLLRALRGGFGTARFQFGSCLSPARRGPTSGSKWLPVVRDWRQSTLRD